MNEQILKEIQKISEQLVKTDWIGIVLGILSTIIALIAIAISIFTAIKQNKIALYDRRYSLWERLENVYSRVEGIGKLQEYTNKDTNVDTNVENFRTFFISIYVGERYKENADLLIRLLFVIEEDKRLLAQSKYLFTKEIYLEITNFTKELNAFMMKLFMGNLIKDDLMKEKDSFVMYAKNSRQKTENKIENSIRLLRGKK